MTTMILTHDVPCVSARVAGLTPVVHGGASHLELAARSLDPAQVVDLSTNVHPYGAPPSVAEAIARVTLERYPDPSASAMRHAVARYLDVLPDQVVAGNGSIEIIYLLAQAYLDPGDRAVVIGPTFGEYAAAVRFCGGEVVEYRAQDYNGFQPDLRAILSLIRASHPKLIFCCNPNNPTGQTLGQTQVRALSDAAREVGALLVLDEAYRALADDGVYAWSSLDLPQCGPVVVLRSLTKDYALPGLRLGYAVAPIEVGRLLNALRIPWAVNSFAEEVGRTLLGETAYLAHCRAQLARDKAYLLRSLDRIGAAYVPSVVNYCLIQVGDHAGAAADCRNALLTHGVVVRDCSNFGLPSYIRVSVHNRLATDRLTAGLVSWRDALRRRAEGMCGGHGR